MSQKIIIDWNKIKKEYSEAYNYYLNEKAISSDNINYLEISEVIGFLIKEELLTNFSFDVEDLYTAFKTLNIQLQYENFIKE